MAENLHAKLAQKYSLRTSADALLAKGDNDEPSFGLEITSQFWEFWDGPYVGTDLRGTFYYNRGLFRERLSKVGVTKADYCADQKWAQEKRFLHVQFFTPDSTGLLGEFLAEDEFDIAESTGLLGRRRHGEWRKAEYIIADATASKAKNHTKMTIRCGAVGEAIEVECNPGDKIYQDAIDGVFGRLFLKSIDALHKVNSVSWYHDRVILHEHSNIKDRSLFFLPSEASRDDPHRQCPLGADCEKTLEHAKWKSIRNSEIG
ncbi:hypothetical protein EV363DRAFT_1356917 [Boletus edulis]|nr:hypothetical protein EV363DRAFT_1356917 [Boletus edulis]